MSESFPKFMPTPNHTSRKLREYQAGQNKNKKNVHLRILYSNCRNSKIKKKSWNKPEKEKCLYYRGGKIRIISDFSETMQTRTEQSEEKLPRLIYPAKLFFKYEGEIVFLEQTEI